MLRNARVHVLKVRTKVADEVRFLRNWVERPLTTGAVAPSGPALTRLMASYVEAERDGPIVELGPGTGVVTEALIARGIPQERLVLVEFNPDFVKLLRQRYPRVKVIQGDAYNLFETLGRPERGSLATVISGLPLFTKPLPQRRTLIHDCLRMLDPGAPFIQFSYALVPAIPEERGAVRVNRSPWVVRNVPPARVWLFRDWHATEHSRTAAA